MSKTLTFGTVPSFEEFEAACRTDGGIPYCIGLRGADLRNMMSAGLADTGRMQSQHLHGEYLDCFYGPEQLYRLVENLVELHHIDSDPKFAEWAGSFASSILSTLGFEWV